MGLQQILLIVLSVIIVGIAIAVGFAMFQSQAMRSHRQAIVSQINTMMVEALAHQKTPASMGGGGGRLWGYAPAGSVPHNGHIGSPANAGVKIETDEVNYFIEWWAEGSYPQRVKIIASSKIYGEGNSWSNVKNARIIAFFDAYGALIYSTNPNMSGFMTTGNWK